MCFFPLSAHLPLLIRAKKALWLPLSPRCPIHALLVPALTGFLPAPDSPAIPGRSPSSPACRPHPVSRLSQLRLRQFFPTALMALWHPAPKLCCGLRQPHICALYIEVIELTSSFCFPKSTSTPVKLIIFFTSLSFLFDLRLLPFKHNCQDLSIWFF